MGVFYSTVDDRGNRTNVSLLDGNDVAYPVDEITNRYNSVGGDGLTYDKGGNLTKDKDGHKYKYDCESRTGCRKKGGQAGCTACGAVTRISRLLRERT